MSSLVQSAADEEANRAPRAACLTEPVKAATRLMGTAAVLVPIASVARRSAPLATRPRTARSIIPAFHCVYSSFGLSIPMHSPFFIGRAGMRIVHATDIHFTCVPSLAQLWGKRMWGTFNL